MSAMMEGNQIDPMGFAAAGKPILYTPIWSYKIEDGLTRVTIYKMKIPYVVYHANGNLRMVLRNLFDVAAGLCDELQNHEVVDFLTMLRQITYDLMQFN